MFEDSMCFSILGGPLMTLNSSFLALFPAAAITINHDTNPHGKQIIVIDLSGFVETITYNVIPLLPI